MGYAIARKVPPPKFGRTGGRPRKYPFPKMKVGDSFKVSEEDSNLVRWSAGHYGRNHDMTFTVQMDDREKRTYRCWRLT